MKKTVLIISQYFAPVNTIASIRFTKIAKYLQATGNYRFVVITRSSGDKKDPLLTRDLKAMGADIKVLGIDVMDNFIDRMRGNTGGGNANAGASAGSGTNAVKFMPVTEANAKEKAYKYANTAKYIYNERLFAKRGLALFKRMKNIKFDAMISSYGDAGAHLLAERIKDENPDLKWIADFRDPAIMYYRPRSFDRFFNKMMEDVNRRAFAITGVNRVSMGICADTDRSHVVINGFDPEDTAEIKQAIKSGDGIELPFNDGRFHIIYTGRIYGGKTDFGFFFAALRELIDTGMIDMSEVVVDYAGGNFDLLTEQAAEYALSGMLCDHGFVERKQALTMQLTSQMLLVISWNDNDEEDMLTGKFMEYLNAERNVLAIVNGNRSGSKIYEILTESGAGFAFEEARGEEAKAALKEYILKGYTEYKETGDFSYKGNSEVIGQYSYPVIAARYESIMESGKDITP